MATRTLVAYAGMGIILSHLLVAPSLAAQALGVHQPASAIPLPSPVSTGMLSVESALLSRRSVRNFSPQSLTLAEVAQLLWAAQGITGPGGTRTAPSAGARYPLELYLVTGNVSALAKGVYRYQPRGHSLIRLADGDQRAALAAAALGQDWVNEAAAVIVVAAAHERTTRRYGQRGVRYVHMEAGHAAQNIHLQAVALNLGTVVVGAFDDDEVKKIVNLSGDEQPLCLLPIGRIN